MAHQQSQIASSFSSCHCKPPARLGFALCVFNVPPGAELWVLIPRLFPKTHSDDQMMPRDAGREQGVKSTRMGDKGSLPMAKQQRRRATTGVIECK